MPPVHIYSKPVEGSKTPGNTHVYRDPQALDGLKCFPSPDITNIQKAFLSTVKKHGAKKFLGTLTEDRKNYTWKTYDQIKVEAEQIGSGILALNLAPEISEFENMKLRMVGIFSRNREEWVVLDIANTLYNATMVPLYDTLGPDSIQFVIGHSGMEVIFIEDKEFDPIWKCPDLHNLKTIVSLEKTISEENKKKAQEKNIKLYTWQEIMDEGKKNIQPYVDVKPDDCFTFSYTSGTTGNPKGAMISHKNLLAINTGQAGTVIDLNANDVYLSYLPLPHIFERLVIVTLFGYGATIGFYGGDMLKMKFDLQVLKPTCFCSVPRIYNKFYLKIKDNMDAATGIKACLVSKATNSKLSNLKSDCSYTSGLWDALVFKKTKAILGGNVTRMITGSAPISGTILDFMKVAMCCPFIEGYGQTESTGASFCTTSTDPTAGHVGGPINTLEFKLEDVPDMGCTSEDKDADGKPAPRGEVCIRGNTVFLGYYKDRQKTDETVDKDGWLHTGDVGTILPNGALKIIDRKKNIFKLSQGEYVSPEKVENIYVRAKGVAEVFVHGDSLQNYAISIVVPDQEWLENYAKENNITGSYSDIVKNEKVAEVILKNMNALGKQENLKGFEQAKRVYLEEKSFGVYGCLTDTMKLKRHNAKLQFADQIKALYDKGEPGANQVINMQKA